MATEEEKTSLRRRLAETIPPGGSEQDTNFTDEHLDYLISESENPDAAAYYGWEYKAGIFANLVNTSESGSRRDFSDLHANALKMMRHYGQKAGIALSSRTRIHSLTRD